MLPDVAEHRKWLTGLLNLEKARCVVDLGCGTGQDLLLIADRARADAKLIGLDKSPAQLVKARTCSEYDTRISLLEHDIGETALPFEDASVDIVYSNNLLECLKDPSALVKKMIRILLPEGQVLCAHWDWDSQIIDADDRDVVRRIIHAFCDWKQDWMEYSDGWMGRRMGGLFHQSCDFEGQLLARTLTNTQFQANSFGYERIQDFSRLLQHGLILASDYQQLLTEVRKRVEAGRYFYSITCFVFVGLKKPKEKDIR